MLHQRFDPNGAVVPGATVSIKSVSTGRETTATADEAAAIAEKVQAPYFIGQAREMRGHAARAMGRDDAADAW